MSEKMDFNDGKYTVINDNGKLTALRYGEPWDRNLTGDNLVYWMLTDSLRLKAQRDLLLEALKLALSSHGVMLLSDPPQDAWKVNRVEEKARAAIKAVEEGK